MSVSRRALLRSAVAAVPVVALAGALPGTAWAAGTQWEDTYKAAAGESFVFAEMEFDPTGAGWLVGDIGWFPDGMWGPRESSGFAWGWNGTKWTGYGATSFPDIIRLTAVAAAARNDAWALGERWDKTAMRMLSIPFHWDGTAWTVRSQGASGGELTAVAGSGTNAWAVGRQGVAPYTASMRRWNGSTWTETALPADVRDKGATLRAVQVTGPNEVWAVGEYTPVSGGSAKPLVLRWDGTTVTQVASPLGTANGYATALQVKGGEVWVAGSKAGGSYAARWNGSSWTVFSPTTAQITSLALYGTELRASDSGGKVFRWDGTAWSAASAPRPATFGTPKLAGGPDGSLWYAGFGGVDEAHKYDETFIARLRP
ncbi:hypothetical protein OOK31_00805 [Streptomyces sp. NBC_00249]|uniref:hypothetical protein n=1 Tax=Streptomyces sp. NBC_00249 TaxID=2975690 RepID=UPI0022580B10|nr:hypothetical protein [Streptomyces sp. NBC_00249]MCX5192439.1 hypothetical protein [Streptomyces sp. NBC_00249]